jgi:hypothetical protein
LVGLFFDPADEDSNALRKVGGLTPDSTELYLRRGYFSHVIQFGELYIFSFLLTRLRMHYEIMDPRENVKQYFITNTGNKTTDKKLVRLNEHIGLMKAKILLHWLSSCTDNLYESFI